MSRVAIDYMNSNAIAPPRTPKAYTWRIRSASIFQYNRCCSVFDFCIRAIKKCCQQPKLHLSQTGNSAFNASWIPGWMWHPLPDQNKSSCSVCLSTTSHRLLTPLTSHLCLQKHFLLQFISRHPSYAHSSESFWSHFYYISLELPLPSSPQKSAWEITFWPALIAKLLSQLWKDRFSSESNLDLWNVFVPVSSFVTLELDTNARVSSWTPLWGCNWFCSTSCSLAGPTWACVTVRALRSLRPSRGLRAVLSLPNLSIPLARTAFHTWPVVMFNSRGFGCISRSGMLLCAGVWLLSWLCSQSW